MSERTAATGKPSRQEKALRYQLLATTIPFVEGGGVVFPSGFPGKGYRLDEWQFDRYRAQLDQAMLSDTARQRRRVAIAVFLIFCAAILLVVYGLPLLAEDTALAPYANAWIPLGAVFLAAIAMNRVLYFIMNQPTRLSRHIEDAPEVSPFAFLVRRAQGMLASGQANIVAQHIRSLLGTLFGAFFLLIAATNLGSNFESLLLGLLALLWSTRPTFFCFVYWHFRLGNGRTPTPEDLKPLSLSAS